MYTCRAENSGGSSESSADVVIRRKELSPVFLKRLRGVAVEVGQPLLLEVEVGGIPAPEVNIILIIFPPYEHITRRQCDQILQNFATLAKF